MEDGTHLLIILVATRVFGQIAEAIKLQPLWTGSGRCHNHHCRRFLIRADKSVNMQRLISDWIGGVDLSCKVRVKADIDPYSFM